jgi:hypothetical protein
MLRRSFLKGLGIGAAASVLPLKLTAAAIVPAKTVSKAIESDWFIDTATKTISYVGDAHKAVPMIELHRFLQDEADKDPGDGMLDITMTTPSIRHDDYNIELQDGFMVEEESIKHLTNGCLVQGDEIWASCTTIGTFEPTGETIVSRRMTIDEPARTKLYTALEQIRT